MSRPDQSFAARATPTAYPIPPTKSKPCAMLREGPLSLFVEKTIQQNSHPPSARPPFFQHPFSRKQKKNARRTKPAGRSRFHGFAEREAVALPAPERRRRCSAQRSLTTFHHGSPPFSIEFPSRRRSSSAVSCVVPHKRHPARNRRDFLSRGAPREHHNYSPHLTKVKMFRAPPITQLTPSRPALF